jgi:hypothetical protein
MTDLDAQNKGFFQLKFRKDKTITKNKNGPKARKNTNRKEKSTGGILQMRRFVKATPPPPSDHSIDTQTDPESTDQDSSPEREREMPVMSVQDETLREKTAEWRQKRLDASAAIRKEHKEKEILEHRLNHPSERTGTGAAAPETLDVNKENIPIPAVLSVSPQFPEHKRKATDDEYEEVGKKPRAAGGERGIDEDALVDTDADVDVANERTWQTRATSIMKASAPGVAVAIVAILAVQLFRKR